MERHKGVLPVALPEHEADKEKASNDEHGDNMRRLPAVVGAKTRHELVQPKTWGRERHGHTSKQR